MTDTAIQIEGRGKSHHIFGHPLDRLKRALLPLRKKDFHHFHVFRIYGRCNFEGKHGCD